ncbi:MAG TPA: M17 family peptidase N-terminal domain-containing protein [Myxococcota bacterium]|nr:M17 family peptidase N-terminal domain-containing protein [Myxococcota bacterium]HQK51964.1 M17 family peptidase N-terminal domain-containing protein [Myxococcota bacterium]
MKIQLVKPDLHLLDHVTVDTVVLHIFREDRPPRGLAGLLDWRLLGRIGNLVVQQRCLGTYRESILLPTYGRLPAQRICVFGLGSREEFTPKRYQESCYYIGEILARLRTSSFLLSLPGSPRAAFPLRNRVETFLEEMARAFGGEVEPEVVLVEPSEAHREITEVVALQARKSRGTWR